MNFSHFDAKGQAVMVDVSGKGPTSRIAAAGATVKLKPETLSMILEGKAAKGDVLAVARLAGIAAAKKTPDPVKVSRAATRQHVLA